MRGDEDRVIVAFCEWLEAAGWSVRREVEWTDVVAEREGATLYAEAKGRTTSPGLDLDTLYGQLLRRMTRQSEDIRYAVVVPTEAVSAALRVPTWLREQLGIEIFEVPANGEITVRS